MAGKTTNLYVSVPTEDDDFIDNLREKKIREDKRHYTKNQIVRDLIKLGIEVEQERYIKLNPDFDKIVEQMQTMVIEMEGEKIRVKKSKSSIYQMLLEKGLQNLEG